MGIYVQSGGGIILSEREPIPEPVKRQVRQEVGFGCAICGIPIIVYHHITPYAETQDNSPENIIPLCPKCHAECHGGQYSRETLRKYKTTPHNIENVSYRFRLEGDQPVLKAGTNTYIETPTVLVIDGEKLLTLYTQDGLIFINISLMNLT